MVAVNIQDVYKREYADPNGKRVVRCEIYCETMPETMPTDGTNIDGLDSNTVFAAGTKLYAVRDGKTAVVYEHGGAPLEWGIGEETAGE